MGELGGAILAALDGPAFGLAVGFGFGLGACIAVEVDAVGAGSGGGGAGRRSGEMTISVSWESSSAGDFGGGVGVRDSVHHQSKCASVVSYVHGRLGLLIAAD